MGRRFSQFCVNILLLSTFLQTSEIRCLRRLSRRKLSAEADDIRSILSSTLDAKPSEMIENNNRRDTSSQDVAFADSEAEDNVASQSKDDSVYDDDVGEDYLDKQRDLEYSEHKRSVEADPYAEESENEADADAYEGIELNEGKDVTKRDANNKGDYNEDLNADTSLYSDGKVDEVKARSINSKSTENLEKKDNRRAVNVEKVDSELEFEKQIENQIQERIDSIKDDIKREIERKQQIREIEANNAKYDELELNREDDENENQQVVDSGMLDLSKRSISHDKDMSNTVDKSAQSVRSKRSHIEVDNENAALANGLEKSSQQSDFRSKRSNLNEADKSKENKELVLPVKKRSLERRMIIVEKSQSRGGKKKEKRSSILIPERGHAEVKDELPGDLTLGSDLRIRRSNWTNATVLEDSRSSRSAVHHEDHPKRFRRDMTDEVENEEGAMQDSFLFAAREKPDCRTKRRRTRDRKKAQKHSRRSKRHRAIRESSMADEEVDEERDKRALDEDIALEYKESFGGLQADTGGALGRFKRIRRSSKIS